MPGPRASTSRPHSIGAACALPWLVWLATAGCGGAASGDTGGDAVRSTGAVGSEASLERAVSIVPTNSGAAELLLALVEPTRLAALPGTIEGYAATGLASLELPTFQHYNSENVLSFAPDLVVTHAWQGSDATSFLESRGVSVLVLPDLGSFAGLLAIVDELGRRLDVPAAAAALRGELSDRAERLGEVDRGDIRLVSYTNLGSGGWTAGTGTTTDLLCELVGVQNLSAANGREGHTPVDFETLIAWNPDVFLVGASGEHPEHSPSADVLQGEASLASIPAIASGRVIVLPAELYTTNSHRVVDAAERLALELDAL